MPIQAAFTLTPNEIYESLGNMIISQEVHADNLGEHQTLVDKARVGGSLFGDTKLYYATDVLKSHPWGNDAEAANLLALDRAQDPEVQAIKLDKFRQIRLTLDNYMTKRAFSNEGTFAQFNGVMLSWIRDTKRVYDGTLYNTFIGTTVSPKASENIEFAVKGLSDAKEEAMLIAQGLADLFVEMGDYSRDFNDYGYLRSYAKDGIKVIWSSKWVNRIKKLDLPTIFHKDNLVEKFEEDILPARYFGDVVASAVSAEDNDGSYRSLVEMDIGAGSGTASAGTAEQHVFPGDLIPAGVAIQAGEAYKVNEDIICKVVVKLPPFMSAFEVGTTFNNPRSLTENHYLTFGFNELAYLKNYPFVSVKAVAE